MSGSIDELITLQTIQIDVFFTYSNQRLKLNQKIIDT